MNHKQIQHILVVDDDTRIRNLLGKFLIENGFVVTLAEDAASAREKMTQFSFDLLVLDVMMPGETGFEFLKNLRQASDVPVIMLTAMGDSEDRIHGLESGADDYLPKPFEPKELLLRIRNILQRAKKVGKEKIIFGEFVFNLNSGALEKNGASVVITENEAKLLTILCENLGKVVTREDIARIFALKNFATINERSIDVQITRLRGKIESIPKNPKYLKSVRGKGYVLYA